jgi:hypothetical protein
MTLPGGGSPCRLEINEMLRRAIVTLMLAGLATVAAADVVYKWVDTTGQVHYSDLPPEEPGAKLLGVFDRTLLPQAAESQDDAADPGDPEGGSPAADDADPTASAAASVQRDVAQIRSQQCQQAQQQYKTYVESRRLYRQTADGKREYLTDAELTAARIQAKQDMDDLCK